MFAFSVVPFILVVQSEPFLKMKAALTQMHKDAF